MTSTRDVQAGAGLSAEPPPQRQPRPAGGAHRFRADIEGLRAVAVLLVVGFHAGIPWLTGGFVGVDVFFVVSGFLITGMLLGEAARTGTVSLTDFYARRIRRLLPMSALVLVTTALVSVVSSPALLRVSIARDLRAAALYIANWHFAIRSTDYMATNVAKSPVLHYWSLGVEEQFYLLWPLLILLVARWGRRSGRRPVALHRRLGVAMLLIGSVSLAWSITQTPHDGPWAYYGLHTRAWELAVGGLLAIGGGVLRRQRSGWLAGAGAAGLLAVVASAIAYDTHTTFPGAAALVPVLGTAAVIAAGFGAGHGVPQWLATPPLQLIGRVSYSWYLWHWPCLVLAHALPEDGSGVLRRCVAVGVSFVLALLSYRFVENPLRRSRWLTAERRRTLALGIVLTAASVGGALVLGAASSQAQLGGHHGAPKLTMTPAQADADNIKNVRDCHVSFLTTVAAPVSQCQFGDPAGTKSVVLIGDSHAEHWLPALQRLARQRHWRLYMWTKDTCPYQGTPVFLQIYNRAYPECTQWRASVAERLHELGHVDTVILAHTWYYDQFVTTADGRSVTDRQQAMADWTDAARAAFSSLSRLAGDVVVLRETPDAPANVPLCISAHDGDARPCAFSRKDRTHLDASLHAAEAIAAQGIPAVRFLDVTDLICPPGPTCPVVDPHGVIIYRDASHLTATFSASLWRRFGARLDAVSSR